MSFKTYFLVGGAGFIGSHFTDALLALESTEKVTIYDNFSSGREWHYQQHLSDSRFSLIRGDVKNSKKLNQAIVGHEVVMHFAANPDIARAATEPSIDFTEGIYLTHQVLEAARLAKIKRILYTSGSGVYGEVNIESPENQAGMYPISTYGASKLASEAFISSYCHMFGLTACVFRFANVVGPRQTHGVGYDFLRKLNMNPTVLEILGDGSQSKSYIHVQDVVSAVLLANSKLDENYAVYNVATRDYITVNDIASITIDCMNLKEPVHLKYTGGDRGWKGDVPIVRLNSDKIRALGWRSQYSSAEAIRQSILAMINNVSSG
ncbi:dTDP-glucose 4,6-dehydratase [Legionella massiliensis]|uniref:dTDP-glucose 4,6-dehydratase n=1 Tax=Legionella massiliensis TaxID=1034943 RepID=A0A078L0L8_9GAMM|nr:NAD-dependent epimerase/dehydratase family protein [Legionella massiliensis]CDZ77594.1 dTDP-glucose 4,6-dehydratase [Legionella massiliensis]CEE13332.1 dTDP-glucose 4,6-dehydratase [Legionella massiliensis]